MKNEYRCATSRRQAWRQVHNLVGKTTYIKKYGRVRAYVCKETNDYVLCRFDAIVILMADGSTITIEIPQM